MGFDDNGDLHSIPQIIPNYIPALEDIALFLLKCVNASDSYEFTFRLASEVDYTREKPCFEMICRHLAWFYRLDEVPVWKIAPLLVQNHYNSKIVAAGVPESDTEQWKLEHILLPFTKKRSFLITSRYKAYKQIFPTFDSGE